jgi:CBS domain containing-hemolysin-like protein
MTIISSDNSVDEIYQIIRQHRYSRYPYRNEETHEFDGILYIKDLILNPDPLETVEDVTDLLREPESVTRKVPIVELLKRFKGGASHFAFVTAHGGEVIGFITMEDVLEVIVGDIEDEYRQANRGMVALKGGAILIKGDAPIYRLERALNLDIDVPENVNSVSGLLMWKTGDILKEGDRVEFDDFEVTVKRTKGPRILLAKVTLKHLQS